MPRGVYDRSKLKKTTTKTEAAPAAQKPKGKPGRKPGSVVTKAASAVTSAPTKVSGNELELFSTVRANIETLTAVANKFPDLASIKAEIAEHVDVITALRKKVFGTAEIKVTKTEVKTETKAVEASNGAAQTAYPASVPMPPAPIPSIPTQS